MNSQQKKLITGALLIVFGVSLLAASVTLPGLGLLDLLPSSTSTFGCETPGTLWATFFHGLYTTKFTSPAVVGAISELDMYLATGEAGTGAGVAAIYADTGSGIGSLLATGSSPALYTIENWYSFPISYTFAPSTSYYFGIVSNISTNIYRTYTGTANQMCLKGGSTTWLPNGTAIITFFPNPPNQVDSPYYYTYELSIYAVYASVPPPPEQTTYTVTVTASPNGVTTPAANAYTYNLGETVTLTATPSEGYTFSYWLVNGQQQLDNPLTLTVLGDTTVTPVFTLSTQPPPPPPSGLPISAKQAVQGTGVVAIVIGAIVMVANLSAKTVRSKKTRHT